MRKLFFLLIFFIVCLTNRAQVVNGDLVGDNTLTVADVTSLINDLKNGTRHYLLELPEHDSFASDNSLVVGTWYSSTDSYTFNADGTTDYGEGYTYKFLPNRGSILLYDSKGGLVKALYVVDKSEDSMVLRTAGSNGLTAYSLQKQEGKHDYVDLGLSVNWAKTNVGATKPENPGDKFAWGETSPKSSFSWDNYVWGTRYALTKYVSNASYGMVDGLKQLEPEDDAAQVNWKGKWRMPTYEEISELKKKCYWVWTSNYNNTGVTGYIVYKAKQDADQGVVTSKGKTPLANYSLEDSYIFLPYTSDVYRLGEYWSSSRYGTNDIRCYYLSVEDSYVAVPNEERDEGYAIRPVCDR